MSAVILRKVMDEKNKTVALVAKATGLSINTVIRYLAGEPTHRSTEVLLEQWVQKHSKESKAG